MRLGWGLPPFGDRPHCYKNDQRVFCTCWSFSFAAADTRRRWVLKVTKGNSSAFTQAASGAHDSASRAGCLPRGRTPVCVGVRRLCRKHSPAGGADAPTTARGGTCSSIGLLICTGRRSKGLQGASGKPTVSINVRQLCRKETDFGGLTRRLRRGSRTCSPKGRSYFSFDGERKVCKRKPAARRLREKGFYYPFCRRGSQCRAQ